MRQAYATAALGLAGLCLGLAANSLPAAAAGAGLELSKAQLALLLGAGLWTRALTAGFAGALVDRFGGRRALRDAAIGASVCGLGLGFLFLIEREGTPFVGLAILLAAAGYFSSFAGPAMARMNAARLTPPEFGLHAGLFGALSFPAEFIALPAVLWLSGRLPGPMIFFLPAAAALLGLAAARLTPADRNEEETRPALGEARVLLGRGRIIALAAAAACAGAVRWGLIGWAAQFLGEVHTIRPGGPWFAASLGAAAAGAVLGPLLCGILSDRLFTGRRARALSTLFVGAAIALAGLGRAQDPGLAVLLLGLASGAAFGLHGLLAGAAAMDEGGPRSAGAVSGLLDGAHHAAGGLSLLLVGALIDRGGWAAWTKALIPFSLAGAGAAYLLDSLKPAAPDPSL